MATDWISGMCLPYIRHHLWQVKSESGQVRFRGCLEGASGPGFRGFEPMCPLRRRHILGVQHHTRPCEDALLGTVGGHHTPGGAGGGPCIREYTVFSKYSRRQWYHLPPAPPCGPGRRARIVLWRFVNDETDYRKSPIAPEQSAVRS